MVYDDGCSRYMKPGSGLLRNDMVRRYDVIGDIHGHAARLERLLARLGYREKDGVYAHPEADRRAVFVGDFIDRGPAIRRTLAVVRGMVEGGSALAVMGNHEYNAICFHTLRDGETDRWLRSRSNNHLRQHLDTLYQFKDYPTEWAEYLTWFFSLPLYLDLPGIRVVHATWDPHSIAVVRRFSAPGNVLTPPLLRQSAEPGTEEYVSIENLLKGIEVDLPGSTEIVDKDGIVRKEMRVKWWMDAAGHAVRDIAFPPGRTEETSTLTDGDASKIPGYEAIVPVFFGHYWLFGEAPELLAPRVACLDYSVAKGGLLVAYAWEGESELTNDHFVFV